MKSHLDDQNALKTEAVLNYEESLNKLKAEAEAATVSGDSAQY